MKPSRETRLRLQRCALLFLCALLFCASVCATPFLAFAIPAELGQALSGERPALTIAPLKTEPAAFSAAPQETSGQEPPESEEPPSESSSEPAPPPENALFVSERDLSRTDKTGKPALLVGDETNYRVDPNAFLQRKYPLSLPETEDPVVLIVHTHGTESYLPDGTDYYLPGETFRSEDPERTVVAVGERVAEVLRAYGITVLHDTTMYDAEDYNTSYVSASRGIRAHLAEYPSITYILDIHRDSIFTESGTCVKTLTKFDGEPTAQIMLVAGSDADGSNLYAWRNNFTVASHLQQALNERFPTLARPINLRTWAFNQNLSPGSLLVEIGACGNTLSEALRAAERFAAVYADVITNESDHA